MTVLSFLMLKFSASYKQHQRGTVTSLGELILDKKSRETLLKFFKKEIDNSYEETSIQEIDLEKISRETSEVMLLIKKLPYVVNVVEQGSTGVGTARRFITRDEPRSDVDLLVKLGVDHNYGDDTEIQQTLTTL